MIATTIATNLFAFVLVLGLLIFAHEAGHFLVAKAFKVRVLVFSFGFGKRLFGFQKGDTDYRVSLIPLGGYVRMAGDTPEDERAGAPDEFLSRPKWQRFLILVAGPFVNLLLAVGFVAVNNMAGFETLVQPAIIGEVTPGKPAARAGLQTGDRIVAVNGDAITNFDDLRMAIVTHAGTPMRIDFLRNGGPQTTSLTPESQNSEYGPVGYAGLRARMDPVVGRVRPGSPAAQAGLRSGDRIIGADGAPISDLAALIDIFDKAKSRPVAIDVERARRVLHLVVPPETGPAEFLRGFIPPTVIRKLAFVPALRDSLDRNWKMVRLTGETLSRLAHGQGSVKEFSGPINIARISGEMLRRGWMELIGFMALISLQLGILNLLPIPVLDGGHIMILLIEGTFRRELSLRVKERMIQIGFALLAALMIVVLYNDVITNVLLLRKG